MWRVTGIAVARNKDRRLALVATAGDPGTRDAVWHLRALDSTAWSQLGGPPGGVPELPAGEPARPAVAANADGRFEVVTLGSDGVSPKLWHAWQEWAGGDLWAFWHSLKQPGPAIPIRARPAVGQNQDGRLELFVTAQDGAVWHKWQDPTGPDGWSSWRSFQRPSAQPTVAAEGPPAVVRHVDGRLDVFVTADDGAVWHLWQTAANNGWSGWESLDRPGGAFFREVAAEVRPDGPLVLFAVAASDREGITDELWSREQAGPAGAWRPWRPRTELLGQAGLDSGPIENPALVLLEEPDAVSVQLFLRIVGSVSLHRMQSPTPEFWAHDPMRLELPPGVVDEPNVPV